MNPQYETARRAWLEIKAQSDTDTTLACAFITYYEMILKGVNDTIIEAERTDVREVNGPITINDYVSAMENKYHYKIEYNRCVVVLSIHAYRAAVKMVYGDNTDTGMPFLELYRQLVSVGQKYRHSILELAVMQKAPLPYGVTHSAYKWLPFHPAHHQFLYTVSLMDVNSITPMAEMLQRRKDIVSSTDLATVHYIDFSAQLEFILWYNNIVGEVDV